MHPPTVAQVMYTTSIQSSMGQGVVLGESVCIFPVAPFLGHLRKCIEEWHSACQDYPVCHEVSVTECARSTCVGKHAEWYHVWEYHKINGA